MNEKKQANHAIILIIFTINILLLAIPSQTGEFWESNDLGTALLRGFGGTRSRNNIEHVVPRLTSDSRINTPIKSSGFQFKQSAYVVPGWADTRFSFRKNFTIDATKVTADLTNFPVLIDLFDSDLPNDAQASGNDILFTNSSSHILDHEIELYNRVYNSTHAHLVAWVKMNLSSSQDTLISMYFGNPTAANQENPTSVWDSGYSGVWHLSEDPTSTIYDSTSNDRDGTSYGSMTTGDQVVGKIDGSLDFDGTDDYIQWSSAIAQTTGTYSMWVYAHNITGERNYIADNAYQRRLYFRDDRVRIETDTDAEYFDFTLSSISTNSWTHVVIVRAGDTGDLYINGSWLQQVVVPGADIFTVSCIGGTSQTTRMADGVIDEVRISSTTRSVDWITAEYDNQDDPNNFYTIGEKESSPDYWAYNSYKYRKQITIDATKVSADLTNFPVLIDLYDTDLNDSTKIQTDGDDLVFTTASGVKLDHEIELFEQTYNTTHAHLVAWVRIPSLSATDDTNLIMYYGNKAAISQENPEGVWDSNYLAVHHMEESPTATLYDSTNNDEDLSPEGSMTSGDLVNAQIGQGIDFDNNDDGTNSTSTITITSFTFSAWVKIDSMEAWDAVINVGNDINSDFRWWGVNNGDHALDIMGTTYSFGSSLSTGVWYYLIVTYDSNGQTLRGYNQGSGEDVYTSINLGQISTGFQIGMWDGGGYFSDWFDGIIDEVRIANTPRSAGWIGTEYQNQLNPDTFYSISNEAINNNWWVDGSFRNRKTIIINSSKVSADLTNFPVLIDVTDSDLKSGRVQSDADDIIFFDQTGVKLDHEIEQFQQNSSHGRLTAWVKSNLSSQQDTNITMYYGNSAVGDQQKPSDVWDSNYVGIWHMNQDPAGPSPQIIDSSSPSSNGTSYGSMSSSDLIEGKIDGSIHFDSNNDYINIGNPTELQITGAITVESWIRADLLGNDYVIAKMGLGGQRGWDISFDDDPGISPDGWVMFRYSIDGSAMKNVGWKRLNASLWYHVVGVYNPSTFARFYLNGQLVAEDTTNIPSSQFDPSVPVRIATRADNTGYYNGTLDEIRISNIVRSSDWILTEYNNQHDPNSFYSVTSEEAYPYLWADASFSKQKDIAIDKDKVAGDLSNFPVLLDIYDSDLQTDVQADAADLMFTDSSNTKLAHEIELFNQTANATHAHLIAWVNVPTLFNNTDTLVSMYYGNNKLTSQENPERVWDSNYVGVWHLSETTGGSLAIKDSTANYNHGTDYGTVELGASGQIDGGISIDAYQDYISIADSSSLDITTDLTISAWTWANYDQWSLPIIAKNASANSPYGIRYINNSNQVNYNLEGVTASQVDTGVTANREVWMYVVLTFDGSSVNIYTNGILGYSASKPGTITSNNQPLLFGREESYGDTYRGFMDEVRISNSERSSDWIATENNNQYDPTSFYNVGSEDELDTTSPDLNNFGVEDPGTGTGTFWADITDAQSSVDSALIKINGTEYSLNYNGTYWIKQLVVDYNVNYEYQIVNASDIFDNYLVSPSSNKSYTFNLDNVIPDVLDWEYITANNTFQANVTDSWGSIDTVIVNVTTHTLTASMVYYNTFSGTKLAYMNNTLSMPNGPMDFLIFVNDTSGNQFSSTTHSGTVYSNTAPVASNVTLSRDQFQELLPIFSNSTLYLDYNYSDADSQSEAGTEIRWYKNNGTGYILQTNRNDSKSIPVSALVKGDQWYATVTPKDGELFGDPVNSTFITVQNTPPTISSVTVSPGSPVTTQQLMVSNTTTDTDGDPIIAYQVRWYNPTLNSSYTNLIVIASDQTAKGETWWAEIRASDGTNYSTWTLSNNVTIGNTAPVASNLAISPSTPVTHQSLTASYSFFDVDGDGDSGSKIRWYKNTILQVALNDSLTVASSLTAKGESWYFTVEPNDGTSIGNLQTSETVTIGNSAPDATSLQITPGSPVTADTLNASYSYTDNDTDAEIGTLIIWYKNGLLQGGLNESREVSASYTAKNDIWHFKVRPSDGTDYGNWINCPTNVTIGNTGPSVSNANINPVSPKTGEDLTANYDYADPDSDAESGSEISWYKDGVLQGALNDSFTILAGNTSKTEEWHYKVRPYDGTTFGLWVGSTNITVANSDPIASTLSISPSSPVTHQNLTASYSFFDVDGDGDSGSKIRWYRNGMLQGNLNDSLLVNSSLTTKGESWYFTVEPSDGTSFGNLQQASAVTIGNSPPDSINLQITPGSPVTADILTAGYSYADNDSDIEIGSLIIWYKNGVLQGGLNDSDTVDSSYTAKNDEWHFKVRPSDGTDYGSWISCPTNVTIGNSGPSVSNVNLNPASPKTGD
ncbi:MAG: DUF2341 domain-containing protein, partial [Candidatus Hodarchaeales archaeon]